MRTEKVLSVLLLCAILLSPSLVFASDPNPPVESPTLPGGMKVPSNLLRDFDRDESLDFDNPPVPPSQTRPLGPRTLAR